MNNQKSKQMREIKFRGKRLDNGEWVDGFVLFSQDKSEAVIAKLTATESVCENVDPATVGQFTGNRDNNGKEIYEGDIIIEKLRRARKDGERLVICFDDFEYDGKNANGATTSLSLLVEYHTIEVIGNIHDNPELLKTE